MIIMPLTDLLLDKTTNRNHPRPLLRFVRRRHPFRLISLDIGEHTAPIVSMLAPGKASSIKW
jgi:hypothetical protein